MTPSQSQHLRDAVQTGPSRASAPAREAAELCECGHSLSEHAWSGWGPNTVCVEVLDDPKKGWYGVCPCVRHGDEFPDDGMRDA